VIAVVWKNALPVSPSGVAARNAVARCTATRRSRRNDLMKMGQEAASNVRDGQLHERVAAR
jgi:hypothetical protein